MFNWFKLIYRPKQMSQKIYETAMSCIGKDLTTIAPNEYGCAETFTRILIMAGCDIKVLTSTIDVNNVLANSPVWRRVSTGFKGDAIISPTQGDNVGHVGIIGDGDLIISNNSYTGQVDEHLNMKSWYDFYGKRKGLPIFIYRRDGTVDN